MIYHCADMSYDYYSCRVGLINGQFSTFIVDSYNFDDCTSEKDITRTACIFKI